MMIRSPWLWALVGAAGGTVVAFATAVVEVVVRGTPLLVAQFDSASLWVAESMPLLLGLSMYLVARRGERRVPLPAPPPVSVASLGPPPVPTGLTAVTPLLEVPGGRVSTRIDDPVPGAVESRVKALSELVKVLKEQAERSASDSRSKSAWLADMSHELRTPLSAIVGYAELLQEEAEEQGIAHAGDLRKVVSAGRQLVGLINNLLDLSKIEVGQLAVVLEDVDLAQVVEEVRAAIGGLAARSGAAFSSRVSPGARLVRGDHGRVRQILVNLLTHAFATTKQGQISLVVERATPKRDAWIALRVRDTGPGMTREELARAFDQYAELAARVTSPAGRPGLELALSRQLAELMGGRIEIESEKGVGTTLSVILPPGRTSEDTIGPRSSVALNERLSGTPILVVDAEAFGLSLLKYLEKARLDVKLVTDVRSAQIAVSAEQPPIVVVDCGVEGAWPFIDALAQRGVRIVATSLRDEDVEPALRAGVTAFLLRPIERKLVLATLERCITGTITG